LKRAFSIRTSLGARISAAFAALLVCLTAFAMAVPGDDLVLTPAGDGLLLSAPRLHFLTGAALSHLRDGMSVPFDFQVTLLSGPSQTPVWRGLERFMVSYDLWEERFAVTRVTSLRRSVSHLDAAAAERWCFEQLTVPTSGLAREDRLWLHLEIRGEDEKDGLPLLGPGEGISISNLIDVFSRPVRRQQQRWLLESGPFRLAEYRP